MSLKMRISLALLVAFALVAGIATAFAQASFRETETVHVLEDAAARVESAARIVDTRFLALGTAATSAAGDAAHAPPQEVLEDLANAGFTTAIVLAPDGSIAAASGAAQANESLRMLLLKGVPPPDFPAAHYTYDEGWFLVGGRSADLKGVVVGAMRSDYLAESFLVDALIHHEYAHAILMLDGRVLAASSSFPEDPDAQEIVHVTGTSILDGFRRRDVQYAQEVDLVTIPATLQGLAPSAGIDARVDAIAVRFVAAMAAAFGIGAALTIALVTYALRPLDRITDAARRLGRGEEDLRLVVRNRGEMGALADALNHSAAAIATARRAELERAEEARLAAEDFELVVGDLSRSVGEADTPSEVATRLAEGLLRVTSARAVLVRHGESTLAAAEGADESDPLALEALYASEPTAFHTARTRSGEAELRVVLLPAQGGALPSSEVRKVDILVAQAAIAIHRARAADELRAAKAQKETFLDILSHDLKNPLAVARGRVEMLAQREPQIAPRLVQIEGALDRAANIIEEAVLLSRLERADAIDRAPTDLTAMVEESAASLRPLAAPRGISIHVEAPAEVRWPASPILQRAVENLLSNAVKWSPNGSSVEIRIEPREERCLIRVVDHGPGIPLADRARLFARFERADRTGVKGTGLGLAIARRVTQMHGGEIRIEDTPGGGATFVLDIPLPSKPNIAPTAQGGST